MYGNVGTVVWNTGQTSHSRKKLCVKTQVNRYSPDDPKLAEYWELRKRKQTWQLPKLQAKLAARQQGLCVLCAQPLLDLDHVPESTKEWELWLGRSRKALHVHHFLVFRRHGGGDKLENLTLVHSPCHKAYHATHQYGEAGKPSDTQKPFRDTGVGEDCL